VVHSSYRLGRWWLNVNSYERRAECHCFEDLEHILGDCSTSGQRMVWELTRELWEDTGERWPAVSLGTTLGCRLRSYILEDGKPNVGSK